MIVPERTVNKSKICLPASHCLELNAREQSRGEETTIYHCCNRFDTLNDNNNDFKTAGHFKLEEQAV